MPIVIDEDFEWAAKYPFDKKSIQLLQSLSLSINEILEDKELLKEAFKEIEDIIKKGTLEWNPIENHYRKFIIFYLELLIVRALESSYIENRFIEALSKRIYKILSREAFDVLVKLGSNLGLRYKIDQYFGDTHIGIFFIDFLRFSRRLSSRHWRIYYFPIRDGYIYVKKRQYIRLLSEAIKSKIYELILSVEKVPDYILEESKKFYIDKLSIHIPKHTSNKFDVKTKDIEIFPPCIKYALKNVGSGLSHPARFTLVTFLNAVGYTKEEIINIFNVTPDFNEKVTRYQVEHILGIRGGKIRYKVPSCRKIVSYNFCYADDTCKRFGILHPLKYVYLKKRSKR